MQYRRIIMSFALLKSEKDERKLTTHRLPIFRIADPEDNMKCSVAIWTTVHTQSQEKVEKSCTLSMV